jgi:hypothetical protein
VFFPKIRAIKPPGVDDFFPLANRSSSLRYPERMGNLGVVNFLTSEINKTKGFLHFFPFVAG